ncbi:hypothetical protein PFISCL1PPCAC_12295, partial [Pristionchus fissidentatus]
QLVEIEIRMLSSCRSPRWGTAATSSSVWAAFRAIPGASMWTTVLGMDLSHAYYIATSQLSRICGSAMHRLLPLPHCTAGIQDDKAPISKLGEIREILILGRS